MLIIRRRIFFAVRRHNEILIVGEELVIGVRIQIRVGPGIYVRIFYLILVNCEDKLRAYRIMTADLAVLPELICHMLRDAADGVFVTECIVLCFTIACVCRDIHFLDVFNACAALVNR